MRPFQEKEWLLTLSALSLLLWLICLGNLPLRDWDEGTIAQVAREIWRSPIDSMGWLYPTLGGEPYHNKPPLIHTLIAGAYSTVGVSEWTTRLPGAVLTALGVPLLFSLGRLIFGRNLPAVFAALVYMTMLPVVRHGRLAMLDGTLVTFFLLALFCLFQARKNLRYGLGVGLGLGLITLTKGMIVLLLGGIIGLFLIINRQWKWWQNPYLWVGILLGSLPAIAWYTAQWLHYGNSFLQINLQNQTFNRLVQTVEGNTGSPWYYFIEILKYGFPWLLFLPGGLYLAGKQRHTAWGSLVLVGTIVYLGTISLMPTKLPWYVIPVYPFLALAVGAKISEVWEKQHLQKRVWTIIFAILSIAGMGGCIYFAANDPQPVLIVMSMVLAVSMGSVAWLVSRSDRRFIPVLFIGMYLVLMLLMTSKSWIWELNEAFPVKPVAELIRNHVQPGTKIYTSFAYGRPSLDFYCDCRVIPVKKSDLPQFLPNDSYLLLDNTTLNSINVKDNQSLGTAGDFTLIAPVSN
ncbi:ArnT family glycosyltransferase [Nostoc sp. CMAA1605]|uniref:ArnT family glycosyltransferase n=1 Tax=Nostoc sp. CMAA1605 TaxID=2055159 RepID=UPI001F319529|nr:glycosyltransferase family 39 protein [Nostoc sp. CMAA1605]MCF4968489.1 phospholipid carrier-dependent glycosyltransferase [Nostoc sp. CMAA1605]